MSQVSRFLQSLLWSFASKTQKTALVVFTRKINMQNHEDRCVFFCSQQKYSNKNPTQNASLVGSCEGLEVHAVLTDMMASWWFPHLGAEGVLKPKQKRTRICNSIQLVGGRFNFICVGVFNVAFIVEFRANVFFQMGGAKLPTKSCDVIISNSEFALLWKLEHLGLYSLLTNGIWIFP